MRGRDSVPGPPPKRETAARPSVPISDCSVVAWSLTKIPSRIANHPRRLEKRSGYEVIAWDRGFRLQAAGCQFEPVRAFICGATVVVPGPRSFSKTTPRRVTTKVLTPDDWYSAGYATNVKPL